MNWSDEALMLFVDGELDAAQCAQVEDALLVDAALRQRVAVLKLQRARLAAAFATALAEPVPARLAGLLQVPPVIAAPVIDLAERRAERARRRHLPSWAQWGGMAASVVLAFGLGWVLRGAGAGASNGLARLEADFVRQAGVAWVWQRSQSRSTWTSPLRSAP